jgi:hypothetical protein
MATVEMIGKSAQGSKALLQNLRSAKARLTMPELMRVANHVAAAGTGSLGKLLGVKNESGGESEEGGAGGD